MEINPLQSATSSLTPQEEEGLTTTDSRIVENFENDFAILDLLPEDWELIFQQLLLDSPNALKSARLTCSFFRDVIDGMPGRLKFQRAIATVGPRLRKEDLLALRLTSKSAKWIADRILELIPHRRTRNGEESNRNDTPSVLRVIKGSEELQQLFDDMTSFPYLKNPFPGRAIVVHEKDSDNYDFLPTVIDFLRFLGHHLWAFGITQSSQGSTFEMDYYTVLATIPNVKRLDWIFNGSRAYTGMDNNLMISYITPRLHYLKRLGVSWTSDDATNFVMNLILNHSDLLQQLSVVSSTSGLKLVDGFKENLEHLEFSELTSLRMRFVDRDFGLTIFKFWDMPRLTRLYLDLVLDPREKVWSGHPILEEMSRCVGSTLTVLRLHFGKFNFNKRIRRPWVRFDSKCLVLPKLEKLAINGEVILKPDFVANLGSLQELIIQQDALVFMTREAFATRVWSMCSPRLKRIIWVDIFDTPCNKQRFDRPIGLTPNINVPKIYLSSVVKSVGMNVVKVLGGFTFFCLFVKCCSKVQC